MATPSFPASSFLRLPREIRDEIYELVFATATLNWLTIQKFPYTDRVRFPDSWAVPNPDPTTLFHAFPALCCVSRQLFIETTPKLLASPNWGPTCTLNEDTSTLLYTWLEQFPDGDAFKTITAIRVEDWSMGIKAHMDLALRCPRLRHMTINFCLDRHVKLPKDTKSGLPEFETIPLELMAAYQLERLFEISNLESLVWIFKSIKAEKPLKEFAHRAIKPIRTMFLHGCNRRGRVMTLKYRYIDSADRMY